MAVLDRGSTAWTFSASGSSAPFERLELDRSLLEEVFCVSSFCNGDVNRDAMDPRCRMEAYHHRVSLILQAVFTDTLLHLSSTFEAFFCIDSSRLGLRLLD